MLFEKTKPVTPTPDPVAPVFESSPLTFAADALAFVNDASFAEAERFYRATVEDFTALKKEDEDLHATFTSHHDRAASRAAGAAKLQLRPKLETLAELLGDCRAGEAFNEAHAPLFHAWNKRLTQHEQEQQQGDVMAAVSAKRKEILTDLELVVLRIVELHALERQLGLQAQSIRGDDYFSSIPQQVRELRARFTTTQGGHHG